MSSLAVERALILLRYMVDSEDGLSIREASRSLGYSPASVYKLINALHAQGYVVQDRLTERYHLGPEAVQLGLAALSRLDIRRIARPHLESLCDKTRETVFLAVSRGNCAIYIDKVVSSQPIRMDAPLGVDRPYNCTAVGKTLLAGMPEQEIQHIASVGAFEQRTERSIYELDALLVEIEKTRQQGWAHDNGEFAPGVACIAAPIHDHEEKVIAALTASGPLDRVNEKLQLIVEQVVAHAASISAEIGYRC